jgi:hypothetical protein
MCKVQAQKRTRTLLSKQGAYASWVTPEYRKKLSEAQKVRHANIDPKQSASINVKISKSLIGHRHSTETKEKIRQANIKRGYNPEWIRKSLKACCARPNKFEAQALTYLNGIYPNQFKYTGNGTMIVNHKSADAYSVGLNTVALFHGYYWHLKRFGLEITEDNKRAVERVDSAPFLSAGYKVIFIWEDELASLIEVTQ